jgi:hypothetical protein
MPDVDSKEDEGALADLLDFGRFSTDGEMRSFEVATDVLLVGETNPNTHLAHGKIRSAMKAIDRLVRDLEPSELRNRFVALECTVLLLGFLQPAEAAKALRDLSRQAVQISPSLAQVALVYSINLYKLAGMEAVTKQVFEAGKKTFLRHNRTDYADGYWVRRKRSISRTGQLNAGRFSTTSTKAYVEPHMPWRF